MNGHTDQLSQDSQANQGLKENAEAFKKGLSFLQMQEYYHEWAPKYDKLKLHGFAHVDALEPCTAMISEANKKGLYEKHHDCKIGGEPVNIKDDTYDGISSCGCFGENHIPCKALLDMIRTVKPGGIIVIALRELYLVEATELIDRFEPLLEKLESLGAWKLIKREIKPKYSFHYDGAIKTYAVQISGTVDFNI